MFRRTSAVALWSLALWTVPVVAQDSGAAPRVEIETVLSGLNNPCGVVIRPGSRAQRYGVYFSESGALRVVKFTSDKPGQSVPVITGFSPSTYGKGPVYSIGPLGLSFLDRKRLAVGGGGPGGEELVRVYELPEDGGPISAGQASQQVEHNSSDEASDSDASNFYALAGNDEALFVGFSNDEQKGWILKTRIRAGELRELQPFIPTKELTGVNAPVALTVNPTPRKGYLVAGQMGAIDRPRDSLLAFYNPYSGDMLLKVETGLFDITGLAYSPATGYLYAIDFASMAEEEGGLYRIDDDSQLGKPACKTVKIASLRKPTALAFGPDGALYVTAFGETDGTATDAGMLLKITGEL